MPLESTAVWQTLFHIRSVDSSTIDQEERRFFRINADSVTVHVCGHSCAESDFGAAEHRLLARLDYQLPIRRSSDQEFSGSLEVKMLAVGNLNVGVTENAGPAECGTSWAKAPKAKAVKAVATRA
jgi:hypothetical protein